MLPKKNQPSKLKETDNTSSIKVEAEKKVEKEMEKQNFQNWTLWCIFVVLLIVTSSATCKYVSTRDNVNYRGYVEKDCTINLVESIPIGLTYNKNWTIHINTTEAWLDLINSANKSIEIASMYWSMKREDVYPDNSAIEGEMVYKALLEAGRDRDISLKIVQSKPNKKFPNTDTDDLAKIAKAEVRVLDFNKLIGKGILHTKLWIIDRERVYVGSANMDWRALTQVKELGLITNKCPTIATDLGKIFDIYWYLAENMKIPSSWPNQYETSINSKSPLLLEFDGNSYSSFFASSPPMIKTHDRENDINAIMNCISKAKKFVYISVMDYFPLMIYDRKLAFWPVIDNALRAAAVERKIKVKLLISLWSHSRKSESFFLKSLSDISNSYNGVDIQVKRFVVPHNKTQDQIPFSRVNHNKYMVTDKSAYIGTSNWSGDYFTNTAGIGMVFHAEGAQTNSSLRQQLQDVFDRDWSSPYAQSTNVIKPATT